MDNRKLAEFLKVEAEFRAIEEKHTKLRLSILADLKESKLDKAETPYGTFTVARRTSWEYTAKVEKLVEKVKIEQTKEQQKGLAKKSETEYLRFTPDAQPKK